MQPPPAAIAATPEHPVNRYRAIFLSDIHLGTAGCKAAHLLDFLRHNESEHLFLVGDIIDGWALRARFYWPQAHNDVIQKILRKARKGTQATYVPGNHDEVVRQYRGLTFGDVRSARFSSTVWSMAARCGSCTATSPMA